MHIQITIFTIIFLFGITIGSFLNVCIYRIPNKESIVVKRSHCMYCGQNIKWYDLIPVFSFCILKGKCRNCNKKLSIQYPLVELLNGLSYIIIFLVNGFQTSSFIYCLMTSALIVLSFIDFRTFEIPLGINIFLTILGCINVMINYKDWQSYLIGFISVSGVLYLLYLLTKGRGIGGGDIKLMAACGLLLGWKLIILAFLLGCIIGSVIHVIRMRLTKESHVLAMGPYLSAGIFIVALWGERFLHWYLRLYV